MCAREDAKGAMSGVLSQMKVRAQPNHEKAKRTGAIKFLDACEDYKWKSVHLTT